MHALFEIELRRPPPGSRGSARSVYTQLAEAIGGGRLARGIRLPSTRRAALLFGVSRNTAAEAYERLLREGLIVTRRGSGTFVAEPQSRPRPGRGARRGLVPTDLLNPFWLRPDVTAAMAFWRDDSDRSARPVSREPVIDFRPSLIDSRLFPFDALRAASARALRSLSRKPLRSKSPQGNQGSYALRAAIRRHLSVTRGLACEADDVVVTSGAQQAFDLLARVLVRPGETVVALEDPGYPPMRVPFAAAGAKVVPIGVDDEGLRVDQLPDDTRIICVCPSHQFPLGMTLSSRRREALLSFARRRGAVIVEDDYDGEFRHADSPVAPLRIGDPDHVVLVGTFSKCMLPALRLGFLVAPDWVRPSLTVAKNALDWHCSAPLQLAVAEFISEGHLARHVQKMRAVYQTRREALLNQLETELAPWLIPVPSLYGMHVSALARDEAPLERATRALLRHSIKLHTLSRYFAAPAPRSGLVFGLGAVDVSQIRRGAAVLRDALAGSSRRV